jgi:hypothetical protein
MMPIAGQFLFALGAVGLVDRGPVAKIAAGREWPLTKRGSGGKREQLGGEDGLGPHVSSMQQSDNTAEDRLIACRSAPGPVGGRSAAGPAIGRGQSGRFGVRAVAGRGALWEPLRPELRIQALAKTIGMVGAARLTPQPGGKARYGRRSSVRRWLAQQGEILLLLPLQERHHLPGQTRL